MPAPLDDNRCQVATANGRQRQRMASHASYSQTIRGGTLPVKAGRAWRELAICGWPLSPKARGGGVGSGVRVCIGCRRNAIQNQSAPSFVDKTGDIFGIPLPLPTEKSAAAKKCV